MSVIHSGICLLPLCSMELVVLHGLGLCVAYFYLSTWSTWGKVGSWVLGAPIAHLYPTSTLFLWPSFCTCLRPRWPLCISLRISSLFLSGIIVLVPFSINPSSIVSLCMECPVMSVPQSELPWLVFGHPCWIMCFKIASLSLACVAVLYVV